MSSGVSRLARPDVGGQQVFSAYSGVSDSFFGLVVSDKQVYVHLKDISAVLYIIFLAPILSCQPCPTSDRL